MGPRNARPKQRRRFKRRQASCCCRHRALQRVDGVSVRGSDRHLQGVFPAGRVSLQCSPTMSTPCWRCWRRQRFLLTAPLASHRDGLQRHRTAALPRSRCNKLSTWRAIASARVAAQFVPLVVLRVVSDSIDRTLPDLNRALDDGGALDNRKALKVALASPLRTARLLAANRRAMQRLKPALEWR